MSDEVPYVSFEKVDTQVSVGAACVVASVTATDPKESKLHCDNRGSIGVIKYDILRCKYVMLQT